MRLGEHFSHFAIPINAHVTIRGWQTGNGPALLLLHGFPQTHIIWHKVAEKLSQSYTVVVPDLRGYGSSSKPPGDEKHKMYAKSTMAHDMMVVMDRLGHEKCYVCGHDRGGRVAHKLAIDYPDQVMKAMFLDICPTLAMYDATDMLFADTYWHWFFLIQPAPFPEQVILSSPEVMIKKCIRGWTLNSEIFHPDAMKEYTALFKDKQGVHAMCEDYRAAATIDLEEQREDIKQGRKIQCPVRAYWGKHGLIEKKFKALDEWKKVSAGEVEGEALDCGHYIPEEVPEELMKRIQDFFR